MGGQAGGDDPARSRDRDIYFSRRRYVEASQASQASPEALRLQIRRNTLTLPGAVSSNCRTRTPGQRAQAKHFLAAINRGPHWFVHRNWLRLDPGDDRRWNRGLRAGPVSSFIMDIPRGGAF